MPTEHLSMSIDDAAFELHHDNAESSSGDPHSPCDRIRAKFQQLKNEWKTTRPSESSPVRLAMHPAYLKIIGMGEYAIPLLLEELKSTPDLWFVALRSIACHDPVSVAARGDVKEMAKAWIEWGEKRGYC